MYSSPHLNVERQMNLLKLTGDKGGEGEGGKGAPNRPHQLQLLLK